MKRLCTFYRDVWKWRYRSVEWIVCKRCQMKIRGRRQSLFRLMTDALEENRRREFEYGKKPDRMTMFTYSFDKVDDKVIDKVVAIVHDEVITEEGISKEANNESSD